MAVVSNLRFGKWDKISSSYDKEDGTYSVSITLFEAISGKEGVYTLTLSTRGERSLVSSGGKCEFIFHPLPPFLAEFLALLERRRREKEGLEKLYKAIYS